MAYLHMIKILVTFALGIQTKYHEQQWQKKVFFQKDQVLAAVFSEAQQHKMSSYDIRKGLYQSNAGYFLAYLSTFEALFICFCVTDQNILNCFMPEKFALYLIVIEMLVWAFFKIPVLIMAHVPALVEPLHQYKIFEAKIHNKLCPRKIKIVKIEKQPYV